MPFIPSNPFSNGQLPWPAFINPTGFVNSFDSDLWVAGPTRNNPTVQSQGIYVQHRVTGNAGAVAHDGIAAELRVSGITNSSFLNGLEASVVVSGGANTIPDMRAFTANISTSGTPSGTITDAAIIRAQTIPALAGTLAITTAYGLFVEAQAVGSTNWTIFAPLGVSKIGNTLFTPGVGVKNLAEGFFVRNAGDTGTSISLLPTGVRWNDINLSQTTVGAAGAASALPATPTRYFKIQDSAGATLVVPAYAP